MSFSALRLDIAPPVARLTLDRPEVKNAFDDALIDELASALAQLASATDVRVVILSGAGDVFSAGADLNWMKKTAKYSYEENVKDALTFARMLESLYRLPKATIAVVNGACLGGGVGLISACDVVVAASNATFALREVLLGIAPATISPYVLRKMGERYAHDYFLTGRKFDAARAYEIGLVNDVVDLDQLNAQTERWIKRFLHAGPEAVRATKELINKVAWSAIEDIQEYTAQTIATLRGSAEGQEGFAAFFEKRRPEWDAD